MLNVYVVDDEPAAREMLAYFIAKEEGFQLCGTCGEPLKAIEEINAKKPDLVFLDIKMPELSGFEMLPYLKSKPIVIFCTAFDEFALEAFHVQALDYLLKPISEKQLKRALTRAHNEWDKLVALRLNEVSKQGLHRIVCPRGRNYDIVWMNDVVCLYKDEAYVHLIDNKGEEHLTDLSINYIDEQTDMADLFRINRAQIVRRSIIKGFNSNLGGSIGLETSLDQDPKLASRFAHILPLNVSRRRANDFRKWLKS